MKTFIKVSIISFVFSLVILIPFGLSADPPGMPGGNHGSNGDAPPGGGAPIGGGTVILVVLGLAYLNKKTAYRAFN